MNFVFKAMILALVEKKKEVSPRQVAAKFPENEWHKALPEIRYAAWQLYVDGKVDLIQHGKILQKGEELEEDYRIRLKK